VDKGSVRQAIQSGNGSSPLDKVRAKLEESGTGESEFLDVLRFSRLPEAQSLTSLSSVPGRLLVMALEGWDTVQEIADELREKR
jgi:hypothetical protein